ncbi:MAG: ATP synthase F1 subunit gamma [Clostridiales bacterium]|nr:ATP synthase F1 subunit gamma [Clostridiales bacterium]
MNNANEIRHHIGAVEQTKKITNAMNLISSARMKRVMPHIEYNHRYLMRVRATMKDIIRSSRNIKHPYLIKKGEHTRTYIVIAGDKGMAGAYYSNILEFALKEVQSHNCTVLITVGIIAREFFKSKYREPDIELLGFSQDPSLFNARQLMFDIIDMYDAGKTDQVYIISSEFYGKVQGVPTVRRILPIRMSDYESVDIDVAEHDIIYDPSPEEVFHLLVPQYLVGIIFGSLVQAYASEHFARMNAMQSAKDNADEILKKLKIQYNIARQAAITQEITEITGSAEALRGGDNDYA